MTFMPGLVKMLTDASAHCDPATDTLDTIVDELLDILGAITGGRELTWDKIAEGQSPDGGLVLVYVCLPTGVRLAKLVQGQINLEDDDGMRVVSSNLQSAVGVDKDDGTFRVTAAQVLSLSTEVQLRSTAIGVHLARRLLDIDKRLWDLDFVEKDYSLVATAVASPSHHPYRVSDRCACPRGRAIQLLRPSR